MFAIGFGLILNLIALRHLFSFFDTSMKDLPVAWYLFDVHHQSIYS